MNNLKDEDYFAFQKKKEETFIKVSYEISVADLEFVLQSHIDELDKWMLYKTKILSNHSDCLRKPLSYFNIDDCEEMIGVYQRLKNHLIGFKTNSVYLTNS
nr:hypothetical protein [uncultured Mediterranean phage uvMED]|tara:strand:+ start:225 stop:527 length:303 start_codon:yes stop_codon:yes gene_type:complete